MAGGPVRRRLWRRSGALAPALRVGPGVARHRLGFPGGHPDCFLWYLGTVPDHPGLCHRGIHCSGHRMDGCPESASVVPVFHDCSADGDAGQHGQSRQPGHGTVAAGLSGLSAATVPGAVRRVLAFRAAGSQGPGDARGNRPPLAADPAQPGLSTGPRNPHADEQHHGHAVPAQGYAAQ